MLQCIYHNLQYACVALSRFNQLVFPQTPDHTIATVTTEMTVMTVTVDTTIVTVAVTTTTGIMIEIATMTGIVIRGECAFPLFCVCFFSFVRGWLTNVMGWQ